VNATETPAPVPDSWTDHARCDDPDLHHDPKRTAEALAVCATCPRWVRQSCFRYVIAHEVRSKPEGVWGGLTGQARAKVRDDWRAPLSMAHPDPTRNRAQPANVATVAPELAPQRIRDRGRTARALGLPLDHECPDCGGLFVSPHAVRSHAGKAHRVAS